MKAVFKNKPNFKNIGRQRVLRAKKDIQGLMIASVRIMMDSIATRTPVYTGKTLVNFQWAVGNPERGYRRPVGTSSLPGKTSILPVGAEPRRGPNLAIVAKEAAKVVSAIQKNPYQNISLVNTSPTYYSVEYGTYSENARTPATGITRAAEAQIDLLMGPR